MESANYRRSVFCTVEFAAVHCWPGAPNSVAYLRNPHRHLFYVYCHAPVSHNDRDIEFINLKQQIQKFCDDAWANRDIGTKSCEMIAQDLLDYFEELEEVTVSEDAENGATLVRVCNEI